MRAGMAGDAIYLDLDTDAGGISPGDLRLTAVQGGGAIGEPFRFALTLETELDGGLAAETIDELLTHPCRVHYGPEREHTISGCLASLRMHPTWDPQRARYEAILVPRLARAGLAPRSRVFQDADAFGIARRILVEDLRLAEGVDFHVHASEPHPMRDFTVQYDETDLAFVSRLLEHRGAFFWFEHTPDLEILHLADANRAFLPHADGAPLPYRQRDDAIGAREASVFALFATTRHAARNARVRDYNWRRPTLVIDEAHDADASGTGVIDCFGEHVRDEGEARQLARFRAEGELATRKTFQGVASAPGLMAGHVFDLVEHPHPDLEQRYLVTAVEHRIGATEGGGAFGAEVRFDAIPASVAWRTPRKTPKPRVHGLVTARVDGEVIGSAAPIDEHGRYKVVFAYDLLAAPGGRASRWVRMAQASAGDGYGHHFPLHVGTEVLIAHVNGDPDRPILLGAVPNPDTMSPVVAANPTQSRIRSKSGIVFELDDDCD